MQMWRHGWCPRCQRDRQSCYLLLAHPLNESHVASSGCGKYKYKYKYKCVCVCVCVCGGEGVQLYDLQYVK